MSTAEERPQRSASLESTETSAPPLGDLAKLLTELIALLESLPSAPGSLDALKRAGAWRDKPLVSNPPDTPVYVRIPCAIDFVNVPPAALRSQLHATADAHGNAQLTVRPLCAG